VLSSYYSLASIMYWVWSLFVVCAVFAVTVTVVITIAPKDAKDHLVAFFTPFIIDW